MSSTKPVLAIAGATGHLGPSVVRALYADPLLGTTLRDRFSSIHFLVRDANSANAPVAELRKHAADTSFKTEVFSVDFTNAESLDKALKGTDVLVNIIGSLEGRKIRAALADAAKRNGVKVYFPPEFGWDHVQKDFSQGEWDSKQEHARYARSLGLHVVQVVTGNFIEMYWGPWFGFNTKEYKWTTVGKASQPLTITAFLDVGRSIASLAAKPANELPEKIYIAGNTVAPEQAARAFEKAAGDGKTIEITEVELGPFKKQAIEANEESPLKFLQFVAGEGKIDYSKVHNNDLAQWGGVTWPWTTIDDYAAQVKGRPHF